MNTKFDSGDKVCVIATVRKAEQVGEEIFYTIDESEYVVPESLCRKCSDEDINALREIRDNYHRAACNSALEYSNRHSPLFP